MKSSANAIIALAAVLNHAHVAASAAMTPHADSISQLTAMSIAWDVIEATSNMSGKSGKTIRSSKRGKVSKVSKERSKADGLEDGSNISQEGKITFYVE